MKFIVSGKELEVSDETIAKAIEDKTESITIESSDLVVRDKTEEETFVKNLKETTKTASVEIAVKEVRNSMGLSFEGKTMDNLVEAVQKKAIEDAKIEPNKKVDALTKDIETLKGTISTLTGEKETIEKSFNSFKSEAVINNTLQSSIPANSMLPKEDMMVLLKSKLKFGVNDGNVVVFDANGEPMKDAKTLSPLDAKTVVSDFFTNNPQYIDKAKGGGGGDDEPGGSGGKMTVEQFIAQKEKEGVSYTSPEFDKELQEKLKAGLIEG